MKNINTTILSAALILILAGCGTSKPDTIRSTTINTRNIDERGIVHMPVVADIEIANAKIQGTFSGSDIGLEDAKKLAIANALRSNNFDVLIEPVYDVEIAGRATTVVVKGHGGKYRNFRTPTESESEMPTLSTTSGSSVVIRR